MNDIRVSMYDFGVKFERISIREMILVIMLLIYIGSIFSMFNIEFNMEALSIICVIYILYRLRDYLPVFEYDITHIDLKISYKTLILIFITNLVLAIGLSYYYEILVNMFSGLDFLVSESSSMIEPDFTSEYIFDVISTVIIAPVFEEFLFRGVLFNRLSCKMSVFHAMMFSSILFGVLHGFGSIVSATLFGMCMCVVYIKTRNIFASMLIHMLNNLSVYLIYFVPYIDEIFSLDITALIMLVLGFVSLVYILKFINSEFDFRNLKW